MVFMPGEFEDYGMRYQHHGMVPFNYGDQDLCFLELSEAGKPAMGVLGSHHDGERWSIVSRDEPLLTRGPKGSHDDTIVAATRNAPIPVEDKLLIFYNGRRYDEGTKPRDATLNAGMLRLDGFAGMTVDIEASARHGQPGMMITQPVVVQNPQLEVNIEGHGGTARVALLDEGMRTVPGFDLDNCLPIPEDAVRAPVQWKDKPDISALEGHRISLLVQMAAGTIYSFRM
jgi:hypothetical protein